MKLPSPSKLDLAAQCAYPFNGPVRWPGFDEGSNRTSTNHGRAVHEVAELTGKGEPVDVDAIATKHDLRNKDAATFKACAGVLVERLAKVRAENWIEAEFFELKIAYDVQKNEARVIGKNDRAYKTEQVGMIDWLYFSGGTWYVVDYKTGRGARQTRASDTEQVRFYGIAIRALKGAETVTVQLWHVDDESVWIDSATFHPWDLDDIYREQRDLLERIRTSEPMPVLGAHCRDLYCPIVSQCPAMQAALARIDERVALKYPLTTEFESVEHAAYVWEVADFITAAAKQLKACAEASVKAHGRPVRLEHYGKLLGMVVHNGNETVECNATTAEILKRHLGANAKDAIDLSTSKKAIERVAGKVAPKGKKAQLARSIFEELREAGTLTRRSDWTEVGLIEAGPDDDCEDNGNEAA